MNISVILVLSLLLVAGCTQSTVIAPGEDQHEDDEDEHTEVLSSGEVKEFDIIARTWEFEPETIEVNLGDRVELHIESIDVAHGFMLPAFGINERLEPHRDVHVEFVADKKGTFPFACNVPCGRGHGGMQGQLVVN